MSATFHDLLDALDKSDVVVYVETEVASRPLNGYLLHTITTGGQLRLLRIVISASGSHARLICVLAHELQHAREVAQAPEARNETSVAALFRRIGLCPGCIVPVYETVAAIEVEATVRKELAR